MWKVKQQILEDTRKHGKIDDAADLAIPEVGRDRWLKDKISAMKAELKRLQDEAFIRGGDPAVRAAEAGRPWKEGDGY